MCNAPEYFLSYAIILILYVDGQKRGVEKTT
jgi:hypothetical protein